MSNKDVLSHEGMGFAQAQHDKVLLNGETVAAFYTIDGWLDIAEENKEVRGQVLEMDADLRRRIINARIDPETSWRDFLARFQAHCIEIQMKEDFGLMGEFTYHKIVTGEAMAGVTAAGLITISTPFRCEPLPDDQWAFYVKREAAKGPLNGWGFVRVPERGDDKEGRQEDQRGD